MKIMICTDGSAGSVQSAELVAKFSFPVDTSITVFGVSEHQDDSAKLTASMILIDKALEGKYKLDTIIRRGDPIEEIIAEALKTSYDLVAVGGGGGQLGLLHPVLGSTTSKLARKLHTHFLVTRDVPDKILNALICIGAETPSNLTMKLGGKWLSNTAAKVSLLHVIPRITGTTEIRTNPNMEPKVSLSQTNQFTDPLLDQAIQLLRSAGFNNQINTQVRQGLVVDEVIKELSMGNYALLVVGAHYQPGQDRWQGTLLDDVTDQLLSHSARSVLII